jgi:hypothetical protein
VAEGAYVRLGNTVSFTETTVESGGLTVYNMYDLFMEGCTIQLLNLRYNTGVREPQSGHRLYRLRRTRVWNNTYLRGISETLAVFCELRNSSDPSVELFDTAALEARDCFIRGIDAADGTLVDAEGTTVTDTLQFAGVTPLCTFTGCYVETVAGESATRYAVVMAQDEFEQLTEKVTPVGTDLVVIEDSAAGYVKKKVQVTNLGGGVPLVTRTLATDEVVDGLTSSTTLGSFAFDPTAYGASLDYQFEVVLSVNNALRTATAELYNLTDAELVTGTTLNTSSTTPVKLNSGNLTVGAAAGNLKNSEKVYEVRLQNDGTLVTELSLLGSAIMRVLA